MLMRLTQIFIKLKYKIYLTLLTVVLIFTLINWNNTELRTLLLFVIYFLLCLILDIDSCYSIVAAIVLLIVAAVTISWDEKLANRFAIYAYYFLVVGVSLQIVEYMREREVEEELIPTGSVKGTCIAIASGKGGVGKTTLATNLAVALSKFGRKVLVVDLDLSMPSVDIAMGFDYERSLKDVLFRGIDVKDCIYQVHDCYVLPSAPMSEIVRDPNMLSKLKDAIESIRYNYDFIIMDFPPGSNIELLEFFDGMINIIFVANPDKASLVNLDNIKMLAEKNKCKIVGLVLNNYREYVDVGAIESLIGVPVIAILPEDKAVLEAFNTGIPLVIHSEDREFSEEIVDLAKFLIKLFSSKEK